MERKLHEPLTLPKHPELLHEINNMSIRIKIWSLIPTEEMAHLTEQQRDDMYAKNPKPEWSEIVDLLIRAYNAINEQRENPRRY